MDFFEAQDRARRSTKRLVLLFGLAVAGTIAAGYFSALLIMNQAGGLEKHGRNYSYSSARSGPIAWWNPQVFFWVAASTIGVVGFASLYKWSQMRGRGRDGRRTGRRSPHHRPARAPAAQRRRGNGHRLRHSRARGLYP